MFVSCFCPYNFFFFFFAHLLGAFFHICSVFQAVCHHSAVSSLFPAIAVLSQPQKGLSALGSKLFGTADTGEFTG